MENCIDPKTNLLVPLGAPETNPPLIVANAGKYDLGHGARIYVGTGTRVSDERLVMLVFCHGILDVDGDLFLDGEPMPLALIKYLTGYFDSRGIFETLPRYGLARIFDNNVFDTKILDAKILDAPISDGNFDQEDLQEWLDVLGDSE